MGGSAYDQYGMGMTQEDIDKVFADTDKFSLAAQEAKRKAEEEAKFEQLKQKYGFNFNNVETFEDVETVLEDKGFQFYDNRVIDFFKYKTKGE